MAGHLNLPPCVAIGKDSEGYPGLFAKEHIERGTRLFPREEHVVAVGGKTKNDLATLCHHCMSTIQHKAPVLCKKCKVIGYCSRYCLKAARPLHTLECKGMKKLEDLRGEVTIKIPRPSHWVDDYEEYWPPAHALLVARVINKGIVRSMSVGSTIDWIEHVYVPNTLPPVKTSVFLQLEKYVRLLVPDGVSNEKIRQAFLAISINAVYITGPPGTYILAVYNVEYASLGHICKPNCETADEDGAEVVYTIEDVAVGEQLCISFVDNEFYMNMREIRLTKLMNCFGIDCCCYICKEEMIPNSKQWILEKQKSSLITPWSLLTARKVMVDGWDGINESIKTPFKSALQIVEILEPNLEVQKRVLDKHNVILILTAKLLIENYNKLKDFPKVISTFYDVLGPVGMRAITEYGTRVDVVEITSVVCVALLDLGRIEEWKKMFALTQQIHPKRPSPETLCHMLHMVYPFTSSEEAQREVQACADELGVSSNIFSVIVEEAVDALMNGQPSREVFEHACQQVMSIGHI